MGTAVESSGERGGRPAATTAHELAAVAQRLFVAGGFEQTSIEDVAAAAGISRRTFFRYFATKADVLFADSPAELARLRECLADPAPGLTYREVVTRSVTTALRVPAGEEEWARQRAQLMLTVPALQAHAAVVFADWRSGTRCSRRPWRRTSTGSPSRAATWRTRSPACCGCCCHRSPLCGERPHQERSGSLVVERLTEPSVGAAQLSGRTPCTSASTASSRR